MKLFYVANARMPTEKAHGIAIMKACQAFARQGVEVTLVVPRRHNRLAHNPFDFYAIQEKFPVVYLPTIDLLTRIPGRVSFFVQAATFYVAAFCWFLFRSRRVHVYTRDAPLSVLSLAGFDVTLECHAAPRNDLYYRFARLAARIVVTAHVIAERFTSRAFRSSSILICPNAVDLRVFAISLEQSEVRARLGLSPDTYYIVYTGNFTTYGEDKGLSDIIRSLRLIPDAVFLAVGGSADDCKKYAHEAEIAGVADRVVCIGYHTQDVLALYQRAADVLVMAFPDTPHYRSNMSPIKMFEYMASGRPIIASDLPSIREILNERMAVFVSPGSPEQLASAVHDLRRDPSVSAQLAVHARTAVEAYSWDARASRIVNFVSRT